MSTLPGAAVWLALALALLGWLVVTGLPSLGSRRRLGSHRLPGIAAVVHWWLESWLGRIVLLALWAEAGFHVFGQRP